MGLFYSPRIVTDGLILAFDAGSERSFRGEPTTNLISNANTMPGWINYYRTTLSTTFITEFGTTGYRFINQPSWNGIYNVFNLVNTGVYTFSAWFRYLNGSINNNGATVYISNYGGEDTAVQINKSLIGIWQRISITINVRSPSNVFFYLISYGGTDNGTGNPDFSSWEVTMPQIEAKTYATPFVNGTRGTTVATGGGLIDLTGKGNNGELINGPLYNSSNFGGIQFDGTNDRIDVNSNLGILSNYSIMFWARRDEESRMPIATRANSDFYWFGDNSWRYVHSGVAGEYYYPKPTSIPAFTWGNYCVVYNGANVSIYRQGIFQGSQNTTGFADWSGGLMIGYWPAGGTYAWKGIISSVYFYNKPLTQEEILQNFNTTKNRYGL